MDLLNKSTCRNSFMNLTFVIGGETSRIGELFIDVSPPFLRVEIEWGVL